MLARFGLAAYVLVPALIIYRDWGRSLSPAELFERIAVPYWYWVGVATVVAFYVVRLASRRVRRLEGRLRPLQLRPFAARSSRDARNAATPFNPDDLEWLTAEPPAPPDHVADSRGR